MYGYVDKDGDGWRDLPDGSPLQLTRNTESNSLSRAIDELWEKAMRAVGIRLQIKIQQWPENLKAVQAGHYQMWPVGSTAASSDGQERFAAPVRPGRWHAEPAALQGCPLRRAV